jgi:hypothetical protein
MNAIRDLAEPTSPPASRARARLLLVLAAAAVWCLPWLGDATGVERTGAAGALPIAALWALGAVLLLAARRRGLLLGEAGSSAAIALVVAILVALAHPWLPGPDRRATLLPVFAGLFALAALDLGARARGAAVGIEVPFVRGVAAAVAAVALVVASAWIPAAACLVLALLPLAASLPHRARVARRALELVAFLLAAALFLAPEHRAAVAPLPASGAAPTVAAFLHRLLGIALALLAGIGVYDPEGEPRAPSAS